MNEEYMEVFLEEFRELTQELENSLLSLEENMEDMESISRVFRVMHTIKGTGAMLGLQEISDFTHNIETFYDLIRNGKLSLDKQIIDLTLQVKDYISDLMYNSQSADRETGRKILEQFRNRSDRLIEFSHEKDKKTDTQTDSNEFAFKRLYHIKFVPGKDLMLSGNNPVYLIEDLMKLGSGEVFTYIRNIPGINRIDPEKLYFSWDISLVTDRTIQDIEDVFMFVADECEVRIIDFTEKMIKRKYVRTSDYEVQELAELLFERKDINEDVRNSIIRHHRKLSESIKTQSSSYDYSKRKVNTGSEFIKISAEKIDSMINMAGELVIAQSQLNAISETFGNERLTLISREIERLSSDLRDEIMKARMLPVGVLLSKFQRLIRDLSDKLGKKVELEIVGEETELDRSVIEKLNDPLLHIIRNSLDHGIESPEIRVVNSKTEAGKITISARHEGSNVIIEISDDGKGLDKEKILSKAVEKGIIQENRDYSDQEIFSLIFKPGFSTADKVSDVSGRGVGMDVVIRTIEEINGEIKVDSEKGEFTTITLKIPLTLAIIEGFLIKIDNIPFIIPLSNIEACVEISEKNILRRQRMINFRERLIPFIDLKEHLNIYDGRDSSIAIALREGDFLFAVFADEIIGLHHTVIKPVGDLNRDVEEISGTTILGDGEVALILDVTLLKKKISS